MDKILFGWVIFVIILLFIYLINNNSPVDYFVDKIDGNVLYLDRSKAKSMLLDKHKSYGVFNPSIYYSSEDDCFICLFRVSSFASCPGMKIGKKPFDGVIYQGKIDMKGDLLDMRFVDLPYEKMRGCHREYGAPQFNNGVEDPRIFFYRGKLWGTGGVNGIRKDNPCTPCIAIWRLDSPRETFKIIDPPTKKHKNEPEKNWTPFIWGDKLLFEYSVNPHTIIEVDITTGKSKTISSTDIKKIHLKGGASALPISYKGKEYYLNIGHAWFPVKEFDIPLLTEDNKIIYRTYNRDYYQCFYLFEAEPPFRIKNMTHMMKLGRNEFVQFASGICYDPHRNLIYISYGEGDCDSVIISIPVDNVLDKMKVIT